MAEKMSLKDLAKSQKQAEIKVRRRMTKKMREYADKIYTDMRSKAPVNTGKLRDSIRVKTGVMSWTIGPEAPYANYVEFGTKPHIIKAAPGKVLSFMADGKRVYVRSVKHPGTKPRPFIRPVYQKYHKQIAEDVALIGASYWKA